MPLLDGLSMCRKIRQHESLKNWPPVPVVSLSANNLAEGWQQASDAGFSHYCGKPVNFRDLGHIILELTDPSIPHKFLRERRMPKELLRMLGMDSSGGEEGEHDDEDEEDDDGADGDEVSRSRTGEE